MKCDRIRERRREITQKSIKRQCFVKNEIKKEEEIKIDVNMMGKEWVRGGERDGFLFSICEEFFFS